MSRPPTVAAAFALLLSLSGLAQAAQYRLKDKGDFAPSGQRVEFADQYGWVAYHVDFGFSLDDGGKALGKSSKLKVTIDKRDGSHWSYTCKAKGSEPMRANVNFLYGQGISVVAQCAIPVKSFAKAVDLDAEDVGFPNLVFEALIQDGQVKPGAQRGIYFVPGGQIDSSDLNAYASGGQDGLAVVFRSN